MSKKPKLIVMGYARHGKDTVCEILRDEFGLTFESSSRFMSKLLIFDKLKDVYGYATEEECFADRSNHREEWFNLIAEYNQEDAARLGKAIFEKFDIYCGLRSKREFFAMQNQGVFDYSIWVDRSDVLPPEPASSMSINRYWSDFEVDNNGTPEQLPSNVRKVMDLIMRDFNNIGSNY